MKKQLLACLGVMLIASSAAASVVTPGSDFDAVDGQLTGLIKTITGCMNSGTSQVTALGGLKRQPSSAPDGSQTVTIDFYRPTTTQYVNGVIWGSNADQFVMKSFWTTSNDTTKAVTKTVSFAASEITNTSTMIAIVYMAPNVQLLGMTVN